MTCTPQRTIGWKPWHGDPPPQKTIEQRLDDIEAALARIENLLTSR